MATIGVILKEDLTIKLKVRQQMRQLTESFGIIAKDKNDNKVVKIRPLFSRGFSIQTNGNLPNCHTLELGTKLYGQQYFFVEIFTYIRLYGTQRQKEILGIGDKK